MFPAYFGDPELMSLAPADYAALILERVEAQLRAQIALALPESEADRAAEVAREIIERMPYIQEMLLKDLDATFDGDPPPRRRRRSSSPIRVCSRFSSTASRTSCICARSP